MIGIINNTLVQLTSKIDIYLPGIILILENILIIVSGIYSYKKFKDVNIYTSKAEEEKERLNSLKRYLKEYSLMDNKGILEIYLWEEYLAYATIFNINHNIIEILQVNLEENIGKKNKPKNIRFDFYENKYFYIDDKNQKKYI